MAATTVHREIEITTVVVTDNSTMPKSILCVRHTAEDKPVSNFVFNNLKEIMDMENNMYEELAQYGRPHQQDNVENNITEDEQYNNNMTYKDGSENTICSNSSSFI